MKYKNKFRLNLEDGRSEPVGDLENASRIILIDNEQVGAEDITFGFSRFEPNTSIHKKHRHRAAEEIMYILKGKGVAGVGGQEVELAEGDTLWVPRGADHWFYNPYEIPCEFLFIYTRASLDTTGYESIEETG